MNRIERERGPTVWEFTAALACMAIVLYLIWAIIMVVTV